MRKETSISLFYACLIAIAFLGPQLMKPLHFAFIHHHEVHPHKMKQPAFSTLEKECPYCDFQFFHFIEGTDFYKSTASAYPKFFRKELLFSSILLTTAIDKACAGRAPPLGLSFVKTSRP
ncbi:hypothetical protein [uncultured Flavobacterium sp.]|uniref:hypothetical protein n=1 Tax=uncultured Flavobacterium sp. TaxID=165435 RepID=UPI0025FBB635|nr:hypothetical protein [uncultured Flavobacterium sp.]